MEKEKFFIIRKDVYLSEHYIVVAVSSQGEFFSFYIPYGAKNPKKFFGSLEPPHYVDIEYKKGKGELMTFQNCYLIRSFEKAKNTFSKVRKIFFMLDCFYRIKKQQGVLDPNCVKLLGNCLGKLEEEEDLEKIENYFIIRLLYYQGILPKGDTKGFLESDSRLHSDLSSKQKEFFLFQLQKMIGSLPRR